MEIQKYIKDIHSQLKEIDRNRKKFGSTYDLIVERSDLTFDVLNIVFKAMDTPFYDEARKVNKFAGQLHRKLEAEISTKDLKVLSYHGNHDADWILAHRLREEHNKKWSTYSKAKKQKAYDEFIGHLENGAFGYLTSDSVGRRMLEVAEQHLSGRFIHNLEAGLTYLNLALEEPDTIGEAAFELWNLYLDETNDKETAHQYLLTSVDDDYPDALAAYGRAHWGDWLVEKDEKKAFKLLKRSAKLGSDWGTDLLADSYSRGLGTRKNARKAFELRTALSEDYSSEVCGELAEHYLEGEGVKKDFDEGLRLLKKAMKMGDGKSHWTMANLLKAGDEIKEDKVGAFKILKASLDLDKPFSLTFNKLAGCYFNGNGTKQNFEKAREIYTQLLEVGSIESQIEWAEVHLEALNYDNPVDVVLHLFNKRLAEHEDCRAVDQFDLARDYYEGEIIPKDYKEAIKWYKLAAQQKDAASNHNLGYMYERGLGVNRSLKIALEYYKIAAKQGFARSQNRLGAEHETGGGLPQDYNLAVKWYRLAAKQDDAMGQNNLGVMYDEGFGVRKNLKKAFELYQLSADQGYAAAQRHLGLMYQSGLGTSKNLRKAVKWFRSGAKKGYHRSQHNLGMMYLEGNGLAQSKLNALVCFYLSRGDGTGWSKQLSTEYGDLQTKQVEEANEDILDLEKSMTKSEISKAKSLAEKCVMSDYQTWI